MSSSGFTPSSVVDMSNERDWPANLGMLDWDTTQIVFTKRSLLEFMKYAGVTVDPNFTNIQKLPRFAHFGTAVASGVNSGQSSSNVDQPSSNETTPAVLNSNAFRPSRKVREVPGGAHTNIFGTDDNDALATAPLRGGAKPTEAHSEPVAEHPAVTEQKSPDSDKAEEISTSNTGSKSRRTKSGVASLWDAPDPADQFRPSRRVREMPGGKDSISGLF
ncbi:hypothetical protein SCP_0409830 [Sparassis crispa]|uniref:Uncharacterized protein n=1 Tax=Sparassis crispa TaxID=139825 RepID=A0A401GKC2_9APHY|nr:hypothetical protein SCP_0409830 [Sparassis crispa]GBE82599.1 hypothetical protein SCP_0409830 [Sparassis crispa]